MIENRISYPVVKISESCATKFVYTQYFQRPRRENHESLSNLVKGTPSGELSARNQKRIKEMVVNLHTAINHKHFCRSMRERLKCKPLSFITLTLSSKQQHSDKWIKRHMLGRLIVNLNRKNYAENYIWKAERQKNGNIHFHIITDSFIPHLLLRREWNAIQRENNYIECSGDSDRLRRTPSTEIKACRQTSQTAAYAAKYIGKNEEGQTIEGRVWGCSDRCKNLKTGFYFCEDQYTETLEEGVRKGILKKKPFEFGDLYIGNIRQFLANECPQLLELYLNSIFESWQNLNNASPKAAEEPAPPEPFIEVKSSYIQARLF